MHFPRPTIAEGDVVFGPAAFIAVAFDQDLDLGVAQQPVRLPLQLAGGQLAESVFVLLEKYIFVYKPVALDLELPPIGFFLQLLLFQRLLTGECLFAGRFRILLRGLIVRRGRGGRRTAGTSADREDHQTRHSHYPPSP